MMREMTYILAIEDNPADVRLIREYLREVPSFEYELTAVGTLSEGIEEIRTSAYAVLLLDLNLPDSKGLNGLERIATIQNAPPIVVLTGLKDEDMGRIAISKNAQDYLVKGRLDGESLVRSIRYSIERHKSREALTKMNSALYDKTAELAAANEGLSDSQRAAITLMEDAILARRQVERALSKLRENEERFRSVLQNTPISLSVQDLELKYVWVHNHWTMDPFTLHGKTDPDLYLPEDAERLVELKRKVLSSNAGIKERMWLTCAGARMFIYLSLEPVKDRTGRTTGVASAAIDLTEMVDDIEGPKIVQKIGGTLIPNV